MIEKLRELNEHLIELNIHDEVNLKKYQCIQKILTEEKCFLKMEMEYAYSILRDLGISENNLKEVYMELIDIKNIEN